MCFVPSRVAVDIFGKNVIDSKKLRLLQFWVSLNMRGPHSMRPVRRKSAVLRIRWKAPRLVVRIIY